MILQAKGTIVPMPEGCILFVEDVDFFLKELGEVAEHDIFWQFVVRPEGQPVVVCFDGTVRVEFTEVGMERNGLWYRAL